MEPHKQKMQFRNDGLKLVETLLWSCFATSNAHFATHFPKELARANRMRVKLGQDAQDNPTAQHQRLQVQSGHCRAEAATI